MSSTASLKILFAGLLLLGALAAGVYLSGLLIVLVLGVDVPVEMTTWRTYWENLDTARVAPFATKIKICSAIGFGLPLLGWLAALVPLLRTRLPSTHGNARFAHKSELAKGGMLKEAGNGIVVGKAGNDLIRLGGTRHALLSAPTRSGKGVGAVIPNLLTFEESLMVLDIKQEAFDLT